MNRCCYGLAIVVWLSWCGLARADVAPPSAYEPTMPSPLHVVIAGGLLSLAIFYIGLLLLRRDPPVRRQRILKWLLRVFVGATVIVAAVACVDYVFHLRDVSRYERQLNEGRNERLNRNVDSGDGGL